MPKTEPEPHSGADLSRVPTDTDDLVRQLREAQERTLEYWIEAVLASAAGSMTVKKLQNSVSWRVTRPLRAVKIVQLKVREAGVRRTLRMVTERLAQIRQARKRG
ncbi:MAG TPA: hypothetical protein DCP11_12485 [Microbacteriaceae bacterium]|jgi:hypothetical protein|nr:hypothetical protein [Microbacteriaceae bacterium]